MPDGRSPIPARLEREVKMEAGYRCAIPTCRMRPIEIAHIDPWARVRRHEFANLIALCPTCHALQERGEVDHKAIRQFKANLGIINARYGEYERRLLEFFALRERLNLKTFKMAEAAGGAEEMTERFLAQSTSEVSEESRRAVQWFFESGIPHIVKLPHGLEFLLSRLILDECVVKIPFPDISVVAANGAMLELPIFEVYGLTPAGKELVHRLISAEPLDQ